jgi:hypothetical protein
MALQIKNLDGKIKLKKGGFVFETPVIRFIPIPMKKTLSQRYEFWFVELENEKKYSDVDCKDVVYEKDIQIPVLEELTAEQIEQGIEAQIVSYKDGIEKVQILSNYTKKIELFSEIQTLFAFIETLPQAQFLDTPTKMVLGYHMWAKELLSPIFGADNIIIRMDLA